MLGANRIEPRVPELRGAYIQEVGDLYVYIHVKDLCNRVRETCIIYYTVYKSASVRPTNINVHKYTSALTAVNL